LYTTFHNHHKDNQHFKYFLEGFLFRKPGIALYGFPQLTRGNYHRIFVYNRRIIENNVTIISTVKFKKTLKLTIMKKIIQVFTIAFMLIILSSSTYAQITKNATVTATIVTPIGMLKVTDMNFGNLAVTTTPGTVALSPSSTPTRTVVGGVTLPIVTGTVQAAYFTVSGTPGYVFTITLPLNSNPTIITNPTLQNMTVDNFISNPTPTGTLSTGGTADLYVGAMVHVAMNQAAGVYVSGTPFDVTVNYQ